MGALLRDVAFVLRHARRLRERFVSAAFRERLILTVTAVNQCRYCAYGHTRLALRAGVPREEIDFLLGGAIRDVPEREVPALRHARHWAEREARPDPEAQHTLEQTYGPETAAAIDVILRAIRIGNFTGNAFDVLLCRASRGRFGCPQHPSLLNPEAAS
jgi:AhpD family alkylhydroperoxidase